VLILLIESRVKPERREDFLEFIKEHAKECVKEPGCVGFDVLEDTANANTFFYYEVYKDEAARAAHMETAHLKRYRERISEFRDQPSVVRVVRSLYPPDESWRR